MRFRSAVAAGLLFGAASPVVAQPSAVYTAAVPPDRATLERLNLRTEWAISLPVDGTRDTIAAVQTLDDQLFVHTARGRLIAVDATTGQTQWEAGLGNGGSATTVPVAVNARFVFATNVTRLFAFHRYSGQTEFVFDLGSLPTAGLAADEDTVYAVLAIRPGGAGSQRVAAYALPRPIALPAQAAEPGRGGAAAAAVARDIRQPNAVDTLVARYPTQGVTRVPAPDAGRDPLRAVTRGVPAGGFTSSRSPSLIVVPTLHPPYQLDSGATAQSLDMLNSMVPPYTRGGAGRATVQRTPSLAAIPPSVAASLALSDLRPRTISPLVRWEVGTENRVPVPLLLTDNRVWGVTDARAIVAVSKIDRARVVTARTPDVVAAAPAQAGEVGYFPLGDGSLMAVDLGGGNVVGGLATVWRATVGGLMNHPPVVAGNSVYVSGDNSGVARVDRANGEVVWKSDAAADTFLAANDDFAYVRDNSGRLLVYDARRPTDARGRTSRPLTGIDAAGFGVPVTNTSTDRLFLVSGNGLVVCLRDASAKYARPTRLAPPPKPAAKPAPKGDAVPPADPAAPPTPPPAPPAP